VSVLEVAFAPFVTVDKALESLSKDLLIALSPAGIMLILTGNITGSVFFSTLAAFIISGVLIRKIRNSESYIKTDIFQYAFCGLAGAVLMGGLDSTVLVIFLSVVSVFIFEYTVGKTGIVFPSFTVLWLLAWPFRRTTAVEFHPYVIWLLAAAVIYLIIRFRVAFPLLLGFLFSVVLILRYSAHDITYTVSSELLLAFVILSYPGIIPYGNRTRLLFGCLCAALVIWFGLYGFVVAMIVSAFSRKL